MKRGSPRRASPIRLHQALDEVRFGRERTLNLRASLPAPEDACARAEAWLRERQVARSGECLIITGRGLSSFDGVSVVREAVLRRLHSLRRQGVVKEIGDHTPGSFVVVLAPVRALHEAPARRRESGPRRRSHTASALDGLTGETRSLLAQLAELTLTDVGVRNPEPFIEREMLTLFSRFSATLPGGADTEGQLRRVLRAAIDEYERG